MAAYWLPKAQPLDVFCKIRSSDARRQRVPAQNGGALRTALPSLTNVEPSHLQALLFKTAMPLSGRLHQMRIRHPSQGTSASLR